MDASRFGIRLLRLRPRTRAALEAQVREEVETHVTMAIDHLVARGVPRDTAERDARARFGDYEQALIRLYDSASIRERDMRTHDWLSELEQDVRLALRLWKRSPAFFAGAVLTLALGIGANGAVFSILRATLLQPLPYADPSRLVMAWLSYPNAPPPPGTTQRKPDRHILTTEMVLGWRDQIAPELGEVATMLSWRHELEPQLDLVLDDRAERLNGALVTPNFFEVLGVQAALGRVFGPADETAIAPLIILSDATWRRDFGADPAIVGRKVTFIAGRSRRAPTPFTVLGVLPPDVHFTYPEETQVWTLLPWAQVRVHDAREIAFTAVMRLRPGVSLEAARARARTFRAGMEFPGERAEDRNEIALEPVHDWVVGEVRPSLTLLGGIAALLLVITCVTVANALLARVSERQQELAVRSALGAGRMRLVRQLLTEGAVLSCAGAVAGTAFAGALQPVLRSLLPASVPRVGEIGLDIAMLAFAGAMAAITILLAAAVPALGGTRRDPVEHLAVAGARASAARQTLRWRQSLLGAQAAIAVVLLVAATLLLTSLWRLGRVPLGFDGRQVITTEMRVIDRKYRDTKLLAQLQRSLRDRVRAIPGVTQVGLTSAVPFRGTDFMMVFGDEHTGPKPANGRFVDRSYFDVLRIPLVRGRLIDDAEDVDGAPPVVVISESFARTMFGDEDAIGRTVSFTKPMRVVGVVRDVRYVGMDKTPGPALYMSAAQFPSTVTCLVVRSTIGATAVGPAIRRAVHEVDPTLPAMRLTTIDAIVESTVANRRFYTLASASFATIALVLTVVGLVVVVSRVVTERRRELAIRAALGASTRAIAHASTGTVLASVLAGIVIGGAIAYAGSMILAQFLFEVSPRSPATYASVAALVIAIALAASWVPVRRFQRLSLSTLLKAD